MTYLLDTDHLTVFQRRGGKPYQNLVARMEAYSRSDFVVSIVTVHEQLLGIHAYLNRTKRPEGKVAGYRMMSQALKDFLFFGVVDFDHQAYQQFEQLCRQKIRLAVMDAQIAAIALSRSLILLTRNQRDFGKVPNLQVQDWTANLT